MEGHIAMAICLVLASALCGRALAEGVRRRARALDALAEGLRTLRIHMTTLYEPVRDALERSNCPVMALVAQAMVDGSDASAAWARVKARATRRGGAIDALSVGDCRVLEGLFSHLGQSGREEQDALITAAIGELEPLQARATAKAVEADRLYLSLGLLTGLMLALAVI